VTGSAYRGPQPPPGDPSSADFGSWLSSIDGAPFELINRNGKSPIVLVCEHASNRVPVGLENLGLTAAQLLTHVAWDPGALDLARLLSATFDAPLVAARFSRLVYDCNRPPEAPSAMPAKTEVCDIPGNGAISAAERSARAQAIYEPFHREVGRVLANTTRHGRVPVMVTIHSFTPVFHGEKRSVEIGYLHGQDRRVARAMLANTRSDFIRDIRLNQPYGPQDGVLHSIDRNIDSSTSPHVMIEVRNDLLASEAGLNAIHGLLAAALARSLDDLALLPNTQETGSR